MQWMKSLLFGISPLDPVTHLVVPLILTAAATLARICRHAELLRSILLTL